MTDLLIIGAGPGGYEVAVAAAKRGLQVTVVEEKHLGGTCLNEGCIPTKCLCHTAEQLDTVREMGFDVPADFFTAAYERKNQVVGQLQSGIAALMKTPGVTFVEGRAEFGKDAHTIVVGDEEIEAKNVMIATGSVTKFLPIEGAHLPGVLTSTEMLQLDEQPKRLCVIGGGVIGLEFASIFNSFGSEVTVVEFCKEVLPPFDKDIAKRLRMSLKKRGITFKTGCGVQKITQESDGLGVHFEEKGAPVCVTADKVLMAVGRGANLESMDFARVGIETSRRGVVVDDNLQTNVPGVYAVGDINGLCQLAHAATFQAYKALDAITGEATAINLDVIPSAVFTTPEAAMVGKTEEQLTEAGVSYKAHKAFYRACGKALAMGEDEGLVKLLADEEGHLLGAHILGAHASDLIHEATLLMQKNGTLHELATTVHAHPSLAEIVMLAAHT